MFRFFFQHGPRAICIACFVLAGCGGRNQDASKQAVPPSGSSASSRPAPAKPPEAPADSKAVEGGALPSGAVAPGPSLAAPSPLVSPDSGRSDQESSSEANEGLGWRSALGESDKRLQEFDQLFMSIEPRLGCSVRVEPKAPHLGVADWRCQIDCETVRRAVPVSVIDAFLRREADPETRRRVEYEHARPNVIQARIDAWTSLRSAGEAALATSALATSDRSRVRASVECAERPLAAERARLRFVRESADEYLKSLAAIRELGCSAESSLSCEMGEATLSEYAPRHEIYDRFRSYALSVGAQAEMEARAPGSRDGMQRLGQQMEGLIASRLTALRANAEANAVTVERKIVRGCANPGFALERARFGAPVFEKGAGVLDSGLVDATLRALGELASQEGAPAGICMKIGPSIELLTSRVGGNRAPRFSTSSEMKAGKKAIGALALAPDQTTDQISAFFARSPSRAHQTEAFVLATGASLYAGCDLPQEEEDQELSRFELCLSGLRNARALRETRALNPRAPFVVQPEASCPGDGRPAGVSPVASANAAVFQSCLR